MFKKTILSVFLFGTLIAYSQVGIGTTTPAPGSILDIESTDKGIMIPRVELTSRDNLLPITGAVETGLMVFNTNTVGTTGPNAVSPGFYYWDVANSLWMRVATGGAVTKDWTVTGNGDIDATDFIGTTNAEDLRFRTSNTEAFIISGGNATNRGKLRSLTLGTAALPVYSWNADPNTGMFSPAADNLAFSTNGIERMRIIANGRIGINQAIPLGYFHITSPLTGDPPGGGPGIYSNISVTNSLWSAIEAFNPNTTGGTGITGGGTFGVRGLSNPAIIGGVGVRGQGYYAVEGFGIAEGVFGQGFDAVVGFTTDVINGWAGFFNGDVGVTNDLYVTGTIYNPSDIRIKKNYRKIDNALSTIKALKPTLYEKNISIVRNKYNSNINHYRLSENVDNTISQRISNPNKSNNQTEYGLIAQEVELILPNLVREKKMNIEGLGEIDLKSVNYTGLIPILIQAVQEQQEIIDSQESRIAKLETIINQLINDK